MLAISNASVPHPKAAIVGGGNTPYHLPGLKRTIKGEIIAKAATLFRWA